MACYSYWHVIRREEHYVGRRGNRNETTMEKELREEDLKV